MSKIQCVTLLKFCVEYNRVIIAFETVFIKKIFMVTPVGYVKKYKENEYITQPHAQHATILFQLLLINFIASIAHFD